MTEFIHFITLDQTAIYQIKIQGRVERDLSDWFQGEVIQSFECGEAGLTITVLTGLVVDQPALHGLLAQVRDLGLTLLYVDCLTARSSGAPSEEDTQTSNFFSNQSSLGGTHE